MRPPTCAGCSANLPESPAPGRPKKWCSGACRLRTLRAEGRAQAPVYFPRSTVHFLTCSECERVWCARTSKARSCSPGCAKTRNARLYRERYAIERESELARHRAMRAVQSDEQRAKNRARNQRRRAAIYDVEAEVFTSLEIYTRDDWVCQLCQERIDPALRFPDRMSATLDHEVPLSLGGPHTRKNCRAAHLTCNSARGNRVA